MKRIILASRSPRRKALLEKHGIDFEIICADIDEREIEKNISDPEKLVLTLSREKAKSILKENPDAVVIGADTSVVYGGRIYGKPVNEEDAVNMLMTLSGKQHFVYTGVCMISEDKMINYCEKTGVRFKAFDRKEAEEYVATGEPMDKAGAYGIQGMGGTLVTEVDGDYENVVGLPSSAAEKLKDFLI